MLLCRYTIYHVSRPSQRRLWIRYSRRMDPLRAVPRRLAGHFGPFTSLKRAITVRRPGNGRRNTCSTWPWRRPVTLTWRSKKSLFGHLGDPSGAIRVIIIFHHECHYRCRLGGSPGLMRPGDKSLSSQFIGENQPILTPSHNQINKTLQTLTKLTHNIHTYHQKMMKFLVQISIRVSFRFPVHYCHFSCFAFVLVVHVG